MIVIRSARARRILRYLIPFFIIPALIAAGVFLLHERRYALIALLMVLCALILFATGFERKRTGRRRMVLVSVLTALSVAGRFIPLLKPVAAMTILSGVYLSGEAGFLVGALSAVISNFYFGQGPWTPFQMFAWGLIGLIAGYLSRPMQKSRGLLLLYGLIAGIAYSWISGRCCGTTARSMWDCTARRCYPPSPTPSRTWLQTCCFWLCLPSPLAKSWGESG